MPGGITLISLAALGVITTIRSTKFRISRTSVSYTHLYIPGPLGHTGFSMKRVLSHMVWGSQGIFGVGIGVSATYIFLFVLFGSFLKYSGFSKFINDLSLTLVGLSLIHI